MGYRRTNALRSGELRLEWNGPASFVLGLFLIAGIAFLDIETGRSIRFGVFYLIPVALVSWIAGRLPGLLAAFLAAVCYGYAEGAATPAHVINALLEGAIYAGSAVVIALLRDRYGEIRVYADLDPVTGAMNQRSFEREAERRLQKAAKPGLGMAFIDCDHFKNVNDTHGHHRGTALLVEIVTTMREVLPDNSLISRFGGDEFLVLQPETTAEAWVLSIENLIRRVESDMKRQGLGVTISVGAAHITAPCSLESLVHECDLLMYAAKKKGRNRLETRR